MHACQFINSVICSMARPFLTHWGGGGGVALKTECDRGLSGVILEFYRRAKHAVPCLLQQLVYLDLLVAFRIFSKRGCGLRSHHQKKLASTHYVATVEVKVHWQGESTFASLPRRVIVSGFCSRALSDPANAVLKLQEGGLKLLPM
jgi:hypothetical protein